MFKRIYYDQYKNKIYLWEVKDGKNLRVEDNPPIEYYVPDPMGQSDIKDIYGVPVIKRVATSKSDLKTLTDAGVKTCEASIPEDIKFLQKRYGGLNLKADMSNFNVCTIDIEVGAEGEFPKTDEAKYPIILISVHFSKTNEIHTFGLYEYNGNSPEVKNYHYFADEKRMLEAFIKFFRKQRVDIITGWYCRLFDIPYFIHRCENLQITKTISPVNVYIEKSKKAGYHIAGGGYSIGGLATLDGLDLYQNFVYTKRESYSLQSIGMIELGEGKKDYEGTINDTWKTDWDNFVEYNVQDVVLVRKIEDKKKFIELAVNFCYQALIPFEKVFSAVNLVTGYMLGYIHRKKMVLPDMVFSEKEEFPGAHVMAKPGHYQYLLSYDVESEYPHMIMMYNISPETLIKNPKDMDKVYKTPVEGLYYDNTRIGILPEITEKIFGERKMLKNKMKIAKGLEKGNDSETISKNTYLDISYVKETIDEIEKENLTSDYYDNQQQIRKILINSIYGVLANRFFACYNVDNARAITLCGQHLIKFLTNTCNDYFRKQWHKSYKKYYPDAPDNMPALTKDILVLVDTDSGYFCLDEVIKNLGLTFKDNEEFRQWAVDLDTRILEPFFNKILDIYAKKWGVKQIINFKREKIITQKFILAKKKYADEVIDNEGDVTIDGKISTTGIEIVRTDTPIFCRNNIKTVVSKLFETKVKDKEVILDTMRDIYDKFISQNPADIAIPKGISDYVKYAPASTEHYIENGLIYPKSCPIHVRAAMNYNYMIKKYELKLAPITNGTKMKYIHVSPQMNELHQNVIGFINQWPSEFDKMFTIDFDAQWKRSFERIIERFFNVVDWGTIKLEQSSLEDIIEF